MTRMVTSAAKIPSDENFPVARFLESSLRRRVLTFYNYVRKADDIADNPVLSTEDKIIKLTALEDNLPWDVKAQQDQAHAQTMMKAFLQDARGTHIETFYDLVRYCTYSAVPVGHFLLDIHEESHPDRRPADALCCAHQILNHVQDIRHDILILRRVYMPATCLREAGLDPSDLPSLLESSRMQSVLKRCLQQVEILLELASFLPASIQNRRLRYQASVALGMAEILLRRLQKTSPRLNTNQTKPSLFTVLSACLLAFFPNRSARKVLQERLLQTGSSFRFAIRLLPSRKRDLMTIFYLFCRAVDDCADSDQPRAYRQAELDDWGHFLRNPSNFPCPDPVLAIPLSELLLRGDLPRHELQAVLAGCCMDLDPAFYPPDQASLDHYCQCVAGAVGRVILFILGMGNTPLVQSFADQAGRALQYTNILRDLDEDTRRGRFYLPSSLLDAAREQPDPVAFARQAFAHATEQQFDRAGEALEKLPWTSRIRMWPALLMLATYWGLFCQITGRVHPSRFARIKRILAGCFR